MGNLGFLFKIDFENNFTNKNYVVIFTKSSKFEGNIILGFETFFRKMDSDFYFLNSKLDLIEFIIVEDTKFIYSKITVYQHIQLDFEDFLFRFDPKRYKKLYDNLHILESSNLKKDFIQRINDIIKYF